VNRLVCRAMAAVAGMAVLGMTATLAGAQTDEVKGKPPIAAAVHPAAFTLNDVMQAPFAWDMLAAPKGAAVAWVFSVKGCSNKFKFADFLTERAANPELTFRQHLRKLRQSIEE